MDRRTFMKLLGGLASMPIVGRIAKPLQSETVREGIASVSEGGMKLYEMVVAKVIKEGKKIGESGRVDSYKHPDRPDITVDVNQTDGSAEIYFDTDKGSKGYAKIDRDMETGGTDLQEAEEVYRFYGPEGDYSKDIDEGISGGIENLEEFTRIKKSIGGRVQKNQPYDPRASIMDYATALDKVGGGTQAQKARSLTDYGKNVLAGLDTSKLNPATRSLAAAYGIGQPITKFDQLGQGVGQALQGAIMRTLKDPRSSGISLKNIPVGSYTSYFTDRGAANTAGIYDTGYNSLLDQARDMTAALAGDASAIARTTLGRFNVDIDPETKTGSIRDRYDFSKGMPGATPYDINIALPQKFVDEILGSPEYQKITGYKPPQTSGGNLIRGFTKVGDRSYRGPDGQIYGPETYASIAAGKYPKIYNPDKEKFRLGLFAAQEVDAATGDRLYDIDKMYADYLQAPGRGYFSNQEMYDRFKQFYADGGSVDLTIITMPDISGSGVESLFKTR